MSDSNKKSGPTDQETPPWLQAVSDDEDTAVGDGLSGKMMAWIVIGSLGVVVAFVALIFFVYRDDDGQPVHIAAPDTPVRERPDDPEGLDVPHQDKAIFERGVGEDVSTDASLGAPAERPVETLPGQTPTQVSDKDPITPPTEPASPASDENERNQAETDPSKVDEQGTDQQSDATTDRPTVEAIQEPVSEVSPQAEYRVQLGAYGSEARARTAWATLKQQFSNELSAYSPLYEAVETGDRTLYRLRVGYLETQARADALCLALKAKGQGCLVIKP